MSFGSLTLRRRCRALMADVAIPDPWDVNEFCRLLAERRRRPLRLLALPALSGTETICGTWVPLPAEDVIFVKPHTSPWHRDLFVLHEVAHMLLGHADQQERQPLQAMAQWVRESLPSSHYDPDVVAGMLLRSRYDTPVEQEAETFARLIHAQATASPAGSPGRTVSAGEAGDSQIKTSEPDEVVEVLDRFARALGVPSR